ncbi:hypothetical protein DCS_02100 [Drechmeria coniospora]|uniref:Uncharacterized protein n=1 Tax=Drechmeria coniospora TaxID=98403 RepID=A0A151GV64_DRECN|nr:hypothetical protein DCS_02100 [Drechmeria coniospora]KYK60960.1 hypothetical protein DCS_02100 [Drechmeria coniospora]
MFIARRHEAPGTRRSVLGRDGNTKQGALVDEHDASVQVCASMRAVSESSTARETNRFTAISVPNATRLRALGSEGFGRCSLDPADGHASTPAGAGSG